MSAVEDLIDSAQPHTEEFRLVVDTGDGAFDAYNQAIDEYEALPADATAKARKAATQKVADTHAALGVHEIVGRIKMLPLLAWEEHKGKFPPRDKVDDDQILGVDVERLPEFVRGCVAEPVLNDARWAKLAEVTPKGEWVRLAQQVIALNENRGLSIPKLPSSFAGRGSPRSD